MNIYIIEVSYSTRCEGATETLLVLGNDSETAMSRARAWAEVHCSGWPNKYFEISTIEDMSDPEAVHNIASDYWTR